MSQTTLSDCLTLWQDKQIINAELAKLLMSVSDSCKTISHTVAKG